MMRVVEREAAHPTPLADVRDQIVEALKREAAAKAAQGKGEALLAKLAEGAVARDLVGEDGLAFHEADGVTRAVDGHPREIINKVFRLARSEDDAALNTGFALSNGDYVVVNLTAVEDADPAGITEAQRTQMLRGFENMRKSLALAVLVDDLRKRATIEIPEVSE